MWFETKQFSHVYNVLNFFAYLPDHILIIQGIIAFWSLVGVSVNILKQVVFWNDHRSVFFFHAFSEVSNWLYQPFSLLLLILFSWFLLCNSVVMGNVLWKDIKVKFMLCLNEMEKGFDDVGSIKSFLNPTKILKTTF